MRHTAETPPGRFLPLNDKKLDDAMTELLEFEHALRESGEETT
jgi:hypothetical protein